MANELGQLSARVSLDTTDFSKNMAALKRDVKLSKTAFDLAGKGVHNYGENVTKGGAQLKELARQMQQQRIAMKTTSDRYTTESGKIKDNLKSTSKTLQNLDQDYANHKLKAAELAEQYKKLYIETGKAESKFYQTGDKLDKMGSKIQSASKKVGVFANSWMKVGAVIGVGTGLVVKQAIEWESAVASMAKTIDESDSDPQMFTALTEELRDLSLEIPVAAKDLAELAASAGQLGIKTPAIAEFTEVMAALGVATNMSAEDAATQLARLANITGMSQDDFDNLGSSIVDLGEFVAPRYCEVA